MAILNQSANSIEGGMKKQIDAGSFDLMLDVLQKFQYKHPISSTIRELLCNGIDSVTEREEAKLILSNKAKVEDFYEQREGDLYADSKFNPEYYNLDHLSTDSTIYIEYYVGEGVEKDKIVITDYGVGLGGRRLEKYFQLGSSTKRLSKKPIGKFGLGNKSPLSVGPFYTIESCYNGYLFKFNVYSSKVESCIPQFDLENNVENKEFQFSDGSIYYANKTHRKNGLTITIEAKKHHKEQYIQAIQSQMTYFDCISLRIIEGDNVQSINVGSKVLFENEKLIISDNHFYSKPHVVINKVNYGYINFEELELVPLYGNIGIKVNAEEVETTPSREELIWSDTTKETVLQRFKDCKDIATSILNEELKEEDFVKWLRLCKSISSSYNSSNPTLTRLANIVSLKEIEFSYKNMFTFSFGWHTYSGLREVSRNTYTKKNKVVDQIVREASDKVHLPIYYTEGNASNRKDRYLVFCHDGPFILLQPNLEQKYPETMEPHIKDKHEEQRDLLTQLFLQSKEVIMYDDIVVPEDFNGSDLDTIEEEEDEEQRAESSMSNEERRKLQGKVIVNTPRIQVNGFYTYQKMEIPVKDIDKWDDEEIYYGSDKDKPLIELAALLTREAPSYWTQGTLADSTGHVYDVWEHYRKYCHHFFCGNQVKLIKVAEPTTKLYKDFSHITKFFYTFKKGKISMSNKLIKWNTARKIQEKIQELTFLKNFEIAPEKQASYVKFTNYVKENYRELYLFGKTSAEVSSGYNSMISHVDKVESFQTFVTNGATNEAIAEVAKQLFGTDSVTEACVIDYELYKEFLELIEWSSSISLFLNNMYALTRDSGLSPEFEAELRWYCSQKGVI